VVLRSEFSTLGQWRNKEEVKKEEEKKPEEESEKKTEEENGEKKEKEKKEAPPPPPPHGDKSPFAVFMETLQTEFKKSQEWQESTKQLADSANSFTESPAVRKAREVSSKTAEVTGKVAEKTAETLGKGAATVGKGLEWTWNTPVVKAGRIVAKKTAEGVDQVTKPVRETKVYKDVTSNIKEVVDDGASSRYGGYLEQEERKRQRELRQSKAPKVERFEEDPKYVFLPFYIRLFIANFLAVLVST
jgi:import inner membrane translocase subunit TIM44